MSFILKIFFVILSTPFSSCNDGSYVKMTVVWGYPTSRHAEPENVTTSWEECIQKCYEEHNCALVHKTTTGCDLYRFNSITSARIPNPPYREEKIAFKTTLSTDTCHVNPFVELSGYAYQDSNLVIYKTTITYSVDSNTDKITTFQYEKLECPVESKAFQRGKITVCLSVRFFTNESPYPYCGNHSRASELCKRNGGTLTGPLNIGELEYFKQEILPGISPFDNGTARVWLDGNSINVGREFVMEDSTHEGDKNYPYGFDDPDSVNPGYCLYLYYFPEPFIVDDDNCDASYDEAEGKCWRGAACRVGFKNT